MIDLPVGRTPPNQARAFIHKSRLGRFVGGVVKRAIPVVGIAETVIGTGRSFIGGRGSSRTRTARDTRFSEEEKELGRNLKFPSDGLGIVERDGRAGPCEDPRLVLNPQGQCVFPGSPVGIRTLTGEPVLGIYGAGIRPGSMMIDRAVCGKKMQLGDDGVCYNRSQISNKQRMWPAGRKPLLTGGDMRAISVASRAGKRMDAATARLRKLGMMKKPAASRRPTKAEQQHQQLALVHATK